MMDSQEILRALQAGEISPEDAEKKLRKKIKIVPEQSSKLYASGLSNKRRFSGQSSSRFVYHGNLEQPYPTNVGSILEIESVGGECCSESSDYKEVIAIVGMSGRYPGASTLDQYWDNLVHAKNSIKEIPPSRWDVNQYYDPHPYQKGKVYCKWIGLLEDMEYFDPLFFNISPSEAEIMDPQHRIFLQEGYKAFEDAGYSSQLLSNKKCGVYLGIMSNEYGLLLSQNQAGVTNTTGNSFAIAAARISYFLNLKGPAIPIDTACSSSLVGTHLACQALLNQEIDIALVGGVSLYLTPESYIGMCSNRMLSPEGQCKTFDNSADGFVPGEGVGALVLKRLKDAEANHDYIYGVIIGSGINQDGKTNGITAPSVNSQIELEREIYDKYKIHPESISYVEMHGTGTKLGDPIELEALSTVFKEKTHQKNYCAIGSVKSNIGHTSAASGVASIQKTLLCLKHKKLVPSLNYTKPNEHFDFEDSPFYVNTKLQSWEGALGIPRRACVSSFGFSGTNAHIVIEEYQSKTDMARTPMLINTNNPILFVLSAKSEERLIIYAECMKTWIEYHEDLNLADMAYTLQVGREAMGYRFALLADSREVALKALEGFINNNSPAGVLTAQVKKSKDGVVIFEADEDAKVLLQTWIQKRKLNKVAELWVKGLNIDWDKLYGNTKPRRISLPTYPFARERYWIPESKIKSASNTVTTPAIAASIHPLLHQNTSDLSEQRFSSTFTGQEFFLADHVVKGQRILPGVTYLEMARAAVKLAAGALNEDLTGIRLKTVVWTRPIVVGDHPVQVHIGLFPEDNGEIAYEIYSESEAETVVHSQGIAILSVALEVPILDLPALQSKCGHSTLSSKECYETFKAMGIEYGPGLQGIRKVYIGPGQILARLSLPSSVFETQDQFVLHPSSMDSAIQASIGLSKGLMRDTGELKPVFPCALEELEIFSKCTSAMWALIRYSEGSKAGDKVQKLNLDLCDEQGNICVRMKGFSTRVLVDEVGLVGITKTIGTLMLYPCWKEEAIDQKTTAPDYVEHLVMLCESKVSRESIETQMKGMRCLSLQSQQKGIEERFQNYAVLAFEEIQSILEDKPKGQVLIQIIVSTEGEKQLFSGLSGLLKTAQLENPKLIGQLIGVESGEDTEGIIEKLKENSRSPMDKQIRYQDGKRYVAGWSEIEIPQEAEELPWKDQGIYLITGGAGGLGLIFAKEIAHQVKDATLILTGRSPLKEDKKAQLKELEALGARIEYKQVDVTQKEAVVNLIQSIQEDFGSLHGIIHGAGVIRDNFILRKTKKELEEVLSPKVNGLLNLDQASKELSLDFFIVFSSIAGAIGNIGLADYAAANAFMDTYARYRNTLVAAKQRQGQTLSMNWPLWKEGGMHLEQEIEKMILLSKGMVAMQTSTGIQALYQGLASGKDQVMVMEGNLSRIKEYLLNIESNSNSQLITKSISQVDLKKLKEKTIDQFKVLLGEVTKWKVDKIDIEEQLESYGVDSIMITQLNQKLENIFGEISKTIFFEYQTLGSLTDYLIADYPQECMKWSGLEDQVPFKAELGSSGLHFEDEFPVLTSLKEGKRRKRSFIVKSPRNREREPIAIIGMTGRYPQAKNLDEYWENLKAGKNCITEIPQERWPLEGFYHPNRLEAIAQGKSYSKWGGFLDEFADFDPLFFNISPREAESIDPQERMFLEECWKALEDAGYALSKLSSELRQRTGVFGGVTKQGFNLYSSETAHYYPSTSISSLVNRVSYFLNLQGPSMPIDTMCSSALVAIHEACDYIRQGKGDLAIAGGVNLYLHSSTYIGLSIGQILSDTSKCKAFCKGGTGFVPGEGVGVVVLKAYDQAIKDGDSIYAVIQGTAVNHDGKTNGYMTPSPNQQAAVIQQALDQNNIDPRTISYLEAAANGSEMGDAIEMTALTKVFGKRNGVEGTYKIGSVKPNIGHCESASGMSQLMKVILSLKHKTLVPTLLTGELNPNINLNQLPFQLQQEVSEWKTLIVDGQEVPRRAGITSVGAGGVNAHIIVEEYRPEAITVHRLREQIEPVVFVLSAKSKDRLEDYVKHWIEYYKYNQSADLESTAYTLQVGREEMPCRLAIVINSQEELVHQLKQWIEHQENTDCCYLGDLKNPKLVIQEGVAQVIKAGNLKELAKLWVLGNSIPWNDLHHEKKLFRVSNLPTYPFKRRKCWINCNQTDQASEENKRIPAYQAYENKAAEFYTFGTKYSTKDFQEEYLTFCPFEERIPGFSMTRVFLSPEKYPVEAELMKAKQIEMRQVLFCKEDFNQIHTLFDIGCGHGTDVIQIAASYPHIQTHGFTITKAQADLGNQRIAKMDLGSQTKIFHKDSSKDAFPGRYDIIIGIEVSFHIRNKHGLFQNISTSLNEDGKVLLMDYIANLRGSIVDPKVEISIPTKQDWINILSMHNLVIDEIIDVSPQIANFLYDSEIEQNIKNLPEVAQNTFRNYANQSTSLEQGWISYCLFKLKKDTKRSDSERRDYNANKLSNKIPYPEAFKEMLNLGHIPYPNGKNLEEKLSNKQKDNKNYQIAGNEIQDQIIQGMPKIQEILMQIFIVTLRLHREELEGTEIFQELGIGSINAVQLLEAINTQFNLNMPTSIMFECSTLSSLAKHIVDQLEERQTKQSILKNQETYSTEEYFEERYTTGNTFEKSTYEEKNHPFFDKTNDQTVSDDIAIIGLSCRCAGANEQDEFWDLVSQGKDCIQEVKDKDWLDFFKLNSSENIPWRYGVMEDIECFDPLFFNISPKEAESMDVSQRILLEECYKALEDAGYTPSLLRGQQVGTIIGAMGGSPIKEDYAHFAMLGLDNSILAARIAYFLDLKGPSLAINTACSSSLVAIDIACQKLKNHDINLAIAGGITIYSHPGAFVSMKNAGMLSPTGECSPFDHGANGIVVGDGVGIVILKRLQEAQQDDDYIYGVIRGSGTNQDGQTSGITVPSFLSQSQLQESVFRKNQINVEDVQYIEAHGTGTKLGDPVEIHALSNSMGKFTAKKRFCAIGSLKANIGHTTTAAGVLSVIKVLLSLKNKQMPPSINFTKENEHIDFDNSPVYVNTSLKEWPTNSKGSRLAAISAFGFSGTNAHLVIEEHAGNSRRPSAQINESALGVFILSAESQEGLRSYAKKTKEFIQVHKDINLADFLYTFQIARESMKYRLALVASNKEILITQLEQFIDGNSTKSSDRYVGKMSKTEGLNIGDTEEGKEFISNLVKHNKVKKLAELWVNGNQIDWEVLYQKGSVKRLSGLPTYPFARERYGVPRIEVKSVGSNTATTSAAVVSIHPLLHQNTSDLSEQRFSSTFTGQEFFFEDHVVKGQRVLPGVAYLEMARAAVDLAAGALEEGQTMTRLKNVVWARPIAVGDQSVQVHIALYSEDNREIAYEIYSESEADDVETVVHSQGSAMLSKVLEVPTLDLLDLQAQCTQSTLSSAQCYETFKAMGINYGQGYQGIENVYVGSGQVLAKLSLPSSVSETQDQFVLHPSLLDSAIQASIGLSIGLMKDTGELKPVVPFSLEELEIFSKCTSTMWALIRYSEGSKAGDKVQKIDIDLCDDQGNVCVRMKEFSTKVLEGEVGTVGSTATLGTLILQPSWNEQAIVEEGAISAYTEHLVMLCEQSEVSRESIEKQMSGVRCLSLQSQQKGIEERFQNYTALAFEEIQSILIYKPKGQVLIQIIASTENEQQIFSGLSGLLKTAQLENPKLTGQLIEVESGEDLDGIIEKLKENSRSSMDKQIRYQDGKRYVASWSEIEVSQEAEELPWKDQGIYLITGGAGGLGLIFAKEIAHQVKDATLILTGRSPLKEDKQAQIKELEALGARIEYKQVDVTQKEAVVNLIQSIQEDFGSLHGIIHGAGVIRDNFILRKTKKELEEVLSPKVNGLLNLDQASKELSLDFFIVFSSVAGAMGNIGQADYSTANAFMDAYARYRNTLVALKQRQGQTLSLNWPLWKEGGMHIDQETEKMMMQSMGMVAMQTSTGIRALYKGLASGKDQVMVMEGNLLRMNQKLLSLSITTSTTAQHKKALAVSDSITGIDTSRLIDKLQMALMRKVSKLLKVKTDDIDTDTELNEYGFDSITLTEFTNKLNQVYKLELTPTIFFEHSTLRSLAEYLVKGYQAVFVAQFAGQTRAEIRMQAIEDEAEESPSNKRRRSRFARALGSSVLEPNIPTPEPIAIVGMSGIFPMAKDVNEFWRNLAEGKDCITEIPKSRWDWQRYYGDPTKEANKTNIKWGGFIDGLDEFDTSFFGISPREAELMDPTQRLLMTYIWKAVEDAGYSAQSLSGSKTAIFVGTGSSGYSGLISQANVAIEANTATGMLPSVGPNRMSYFLNVHGPSEPIETACSSSLVAIHRAVSAMGDGTCEMAIVGGVNTIVTPEGHISLNKAGMLCEDGRCKTFSNQANGYVRGEGVGMLFLKKLKDAEQAGDHIYGVIRGTAENHGGRGNSLTSPNPKAQAELVQTAYLKAGIDPRTVTYIETHGTGTELGDPIEINGLKTAFKELYQATGDPQITSAHCGLGSVKTNIGHLELAAGIAGVIKVLLQLKHKTLIKSLHCDTINPYIQLKDSPFYIVQETEAWKPLQDARSKDLPRRAGVSSFGFGGANAHVVIEEYIPENKERPPITISPQNPAIIVLSAKNEERFKEQVQQLLAAIEEQQFSDASLADIAYTLQVGREAMEERLAVIVGSIKELEEKLKGFVEGQDGIEDLYRGQVKRSKETLVIFTTDEDMQKAIDSWIAKAKYAKLLDLWVKGLNFDWNKLYGDNKPRRISLPTYPFAREHYWVPQIETTSSSFQCKIQFDKASYERILDEVMNDTLSMDTAIQKTKDLLF